MHHSVLLQILLTINTAVGIGGILRTEAQLFDFLEQTRHKDFPNA